MTASGLPEPSGSDRSNHARHGPHRRMLGLALPIIVSNLSVPLVGLVDTAVMGRLPDPIYLGAAALGAVVFSSLFWAFGFLRMGTTGLVAQSVGARDGQTLRRLLLQNAVVALSFGVLLLATTPLVMMAARAFLPASDDLHALLDTYIAVRIWSAPMVLCNYVLMGFFVGLQRTGFALVTQLALNLANVALSLLFVLHWDMGVAGVALASVLAEGLSLVIGMALLAHLARRWPVAPWPWRAWREWAGYRRLVAVNSDLFVRTLCLLAAFAWFARQGVLLGEVTLAANAVLLQFVHVLAFGLDGFAHAAEALVGAAVGARDRRAFRSAVRVSSIWAVGTAAVFMLVYGLTGGAFIAMLTANDAVRLAAAEYLPWVVAMPLLAVWCYQLDGIFVGSLQTRAMRLSMLVATSGFLLLSVALQAAYGNHGLWAALALFFVLRAAGLGWFLRRDPPV